MASTPTFSNSFLPHPSQLYPLSQLDWMGYMQSSPTKSKPNPTTPSAKVYKIIQKPEEKMTIILWTDKTKTIAKVGHDDVYNEEHGVAMCVLKKIFGSYSKYEKFIGGER